MKRYYTYITASRKRGAIYTGVTSDLVLRIYQHKQKLYHGFTKKYNAGMLVWYQEFEWIQDAIRKEKQIKGWKRDKKIALIEASNPDWIDLHKFVG